MFLAVWCVFTFLRFNAALKIQWPPPHDTTALAVSGPYLWSSPGKVPKGTVTLSITTIPAERETIADFVHHVLSAVQYPFTARQVIVDTWKATKADCIAMYAKLDALVSEGALSHYTIVDYAPKNVERMLKLFVNDSTIPIRPIERQGFLSYLTGIDQCATDYFWHLDSDIHLYNSKVRNPVVDFVELLNALPNLILVDLPEDLGPVDCELGDSFWKHWTDPNPNAFKRTANKNDRGYIEKACSTQSYFMHIQRFKQRMLPLKPNKPGIEGIGWPIVAQLPYIHPPLYFREWSAYWHEYSFEQEAAIAPSQKPCSMKF